LCIVLAYHHGPAVLHPNASDVTPFSYGGLCRQAIRAVGELSYDRRELSYAHRALSYEPSARLMPSYALCAFPLSERGVTPFPRKCSHFHGRKGGSIFHVSASGVKNGGFSPPHPHHLSASSRGHHGLPRQAKCAERTSCRPQPIHHVAPRAIHHALPTARYYPSITAPPCIYRAYHNVRTTSARFSRMTGGNAFHVPRFGALFTYAPLRVLFTPPIGGSTPVSSSNTVPYSSSPPRPLLRACPLPPPCRLRRRLRGPNRRYSRTP